MSSNSGGSVNEMRRENTESEDRVDDMLERLADLLESIEDDLLRGSGVQYPTDSPEGRKNLRDAIAGEIAAGNLPLDLVALQAKLEGAGG